jgi:hypothetical protein
MGRANALTLGLDLASAGRLVDPSFSKEVDMKRTVVWWLGMAAILGAGCGDSGGTAACTQGSGTGKTCIEYSVSGSSGNVDQIKASCTQGGGVASDTCVRTGADGACRMTAGGNGVSVSLTTWYYAANAASEMQSCASGGGTWISP